MSELRIVEVTDRTGKLTEPVWLSRAERVHRQLRPQLPGDYAAKMARVFDAGGRLCVAVKADAVVGVVVWRGYEDTAFGQFFYVDDLVTDEAERSLGVGAALLSHCERIARELGYASLVLDSGVQRGRAHKFYFQRGYVIDAYSFVKKFT